MMLEHAGVKLAEKLCENDPVRKHIPSKWRVYCPLREMFHYDKKAVICVAHLNAIPTTEDELISFEWGTFSIFYTVWTTEKGLGRKIVLETQKLLKSQHYDNRYVTMSPKSEMATKFHLKNGAKLIQENENTNNFEYF